MNLNELGTTPLADEVDVNNLPTEMGSRRHEPPSGTYRFLLPRLGPEAFAAVTTKDHGARVSVVFGDEFPLTIVQAPPQTGDTLLNTPYKTRLNNVPRKRGKGDDAPMASDWDYLNRALGETTRPKSNAEFAQRLIAQSQVEGGKTFMADVEGSYRCDPTRDARFAKSAEEGGGFTTIPAVDAAGAPIMETDLKTGEVKQANVKGCGARYYEGDTTRPAVVGASPKAGSVAKVEGNYPDSITCTNCQADVRRFTNLTRFKA